MASSARKFVQQIDEDELPLDVRIARLREGEQQDSEGMHVPLTEAGAASAESTVTQQAALATAEVVGGIGDPHSAAPVGKRACLFIHPGKSFSLFWGFLTVIVVIWVVFSLPFKLAFLSESINKADPFFLLSVLVDAFFCTDVVLSFYTGYYDTNDVLVIDGRRIRMHYLTGWFASDLIGALPFDYIVYACTSPHQYIMGVQVTHFIRFAKLLRLARLLRTETLYRILGRWEEHFDVNTIKIIKLLFALIFWLHFDACMFFFFARWHQLETGEWAPDSWVSINGLTESGPGAQYFYSLFHATSHMLSVTYGFYNPLRPEEVAATWISMLCGAALYASVIGTAASIIQNLDPSGTEFHRQWDELKIFMRHHNVPPALRDRLRTYFHVRWRGRKIFNERAIIDALPEPYARALLLHECQWLLRSVPLLVSAPPGFVQTLVPLLATRVVMGGETVLTMQEPPLYWWLLSRGRAGVYHDGVRVMTLGDGAHFGDAALLWGVKSPYSVITDSPCSLYMLPRRHFEELLSQYPEIVSTMKKDAYKQARRMGAGIAERLRADADHAPHSTAFTRIPWDWAAAEAELAAEASSDEASGSTSPTGSPFLAGRGKFAGGSSGFGARRTRATSVGSSGEDGRASRVAFDGTHGGGLWGEEEDDGIPDDPAIAWEKLRKGFDKAGGLLRAELGQVAQRMHLERLGVHGLPPGPGGAPVHGGGGVHIDPSAFLRGMRAIGGEVNAAFRDPAAALELAKQRAQRLGAGVRNSVRRLAATANQARHRHYDRSTLEEEDGSDGEGRGDHMHAHAGSGHTTLELPVRIPAPPVTGAASGDGAGGRRRSSGGSAGAASGVPPLPLKPLPPPPLGTPQRLGHAAATSAAGAPEQVFPSASADTDVMSGLLARASEAHSGAGAAAREGSLAGSLAAPARDAAEPADAVARDALLVPARGSTLSVQPCSGAAAAIPAAPLQSEVAADEWAQPERASDRPDAGNEGR